MHLLWPGLRFWFILFMTSHKMHFRRHRSAEDLVGISCNEPLTSFNSPVMRRRNQKKPRPPPLNLSSKPDKGVFDDIFERELPSLSPLLNNSNCVVTSSSMRSRTKVANHTCRRPVSMYNPRTKENFSPPVGTSVTSNSSKETSSPPKMPLKQNHKRVQSADDLLNNSSARSITSNQFSFSKPLLRQVLDYPASE